MASLTKDGDQNWMAAFHRIPLPRCPTESTVREYLRETFIPNACIRIRQKSRMVGNDEGLNGFDDLLKRLEALGKEIETLKEKDKNQEEKIKTLKEELKTLKEKDKNQEEEIKTLKEKNESREEGLKTLKEKNKSREEELSTLKSDMQRIRIPELLRFLPHKKRPDNFPRNGLFRGADVKFDLSFLASLGTDNSTFLFEHGLKDSDVNAAFTERYGQHPAVFQQGIPKEVEKVNNMKSNLMHLKFWKEATESPCPERRKKLMGICDRIIMCWLNRKEDQPYSEEETRSTLDDLYKEYYA